MENIRKTPRPRSFKFESRDVGAEWAGWAVIFVEAKGGRFVIN